MFKDNSMFQDPQENLGPGYGYSRLVNSLKVFDHVIIRALSRIR